MTEKKPRNLAASVRQRLTNLSRVRNEDFHFVLTHYALERLLYRLSQSEHRDAFVLKGAMLFQLWGDQPHRSTRDLDFLGRGESSAPRFASIFRDVCELPVADDGLVFRNDSIQVGAIKEDQEYEGLRLTLDCRLENARIPIQIDVGFGDVVIPAATEITYPVLLDFPPPVLSAYSRESVVAEKFQAMIVLGIANSRMKDFYDVWVLSRRFEFQGSVLCQAIRATFERRRTPVPAETPLALSPEFAEDRVKRAQWRAFLNKYKLGHTEANLGEVTNVLRDFLMPVAQAVTADMMLDRVWQASGPWQAM